MFLSLGFDLRTGVIRADWQWFNEVSRSYWVAEGVCIGELSSGEWLERRVEVYLDVVASLLLDPVCCWDAVAMNWHLFR